MPGEGVWFYPEDNGEPLEGFKQKCHDLILRWESGSDNGIDNGWERPDKHPLQ